MKKNFRVLGMMSGTSLDGVDLAMCRFRRIGKKWLFEIDSAHTVPYPAKWRLKLSGAHLMPAEDFIRLHVEYGRYLGSLVNTFLKGRKLHKPDALASHGHTIFHQPSSNPPFTFQLGDGVAMQAVTGLPVIWDFRSMDVQLGGQGAPLVPIGDRLLFSEYTCCVNLGGIANISMERGRKRVAWDICFVNMVLNHLASEMGKAFDKNGAAARSGQVLPELMAGLERLHQNAAGRPSLGREDFERDVLPLLGKGSAQDKARTFTEYAAGQVADAIGLARSGKVLLTGGGTHNLFLQERIRARTLMAAPKKKIHLRGS